LIVDDFLSMPLVFNSLEIMAVEGHEAQFSVIRIGESSQRELAWLCTEDLPRYRLYAAKKGIDYQRMEKLITFEVGERQQYFSIKLYNNYRLDLERHFYVLLLDIYDMVCPIKGASKSTDRYDRSGVEGTILNIKIIDADC
jgi:hypothetical protein